MKLQKLSDFLTTPLTPAALLGAIGSLVVIVAVALAVATTLPGPLSIWGFIQIVLGLPSIEHWKSSLDRRHLAFLSGLCVVVLAAGIALAVTAFWSSRRFAGARSTTRPPPVRSRLGWVAAAAVHLALFSGGVALIKRFDPFWRDFSATGISLLGYSAGRLLLCFYLLLATTSLGEQIISRVAARHRVERRASLELFIVSFFCGAAAYGFVVTALGLFGLLTFEVVFLIVAVPIALSPPLVRELLQAAAASLRGLSTEKVHPDRVLSITLAVAALFTAAFLVIVKGIYPAAIDGDVWVHYLHYYRDVAKTGNLVSHDLWYDFFQSKAAGLMLIAVLLGDALCAPLASCGAILAAGFVLFELVRHGERGVDWALAAVTAFFAAFSVVAIQDDLTNSFFKNHEMLAGFIAFAGWASIRITQPSLEEQALPVGLVAFVAAFAAFFVPLSSVITLPWFATLAVIAAGAAKWSVARAFATIVAAQAIGALASFAVNYAATGLPDFVPTRFFWALADRDRFLQMFGASGMLYVLAYDADLQRIGWRAAVDIRFPVIAHFLRYDFLWFIAPPAVALVGILATGSRMALGAGTAENRRRLMVLVVAGIFLLLAGLLSQLTRNPSVYRLYAFCAFFMALVLVIAAQSALAEVKPSRARWWTTSVLLVFVAILSTGLATMETGQQRLRAIAAYATGTGSLRAALQEVDRSRFMGPAVELPVLIRYRQMLGPETRIFQFNHGASPSYAFPGVGVISEPSYSLGAGYFTMVYGAPEEARAALSAKGIDYFHINLTKHLFSSLVYSRLFSPENIERNLQVVHRDGHDYLLTWRPRSDPAAMPEMFVRILDLKRSASLHVAFSYEFGVDVHRALRGWFDAPETRRWLSGRAAARNEKEAEDLRATLRAELRGRMEDRLALERNKALVGRIVTAADVAIRREIQLALQALARSPESLDLLEKPFIENLHRELIVALKAITMEQCLTEFERELCYALVIRNEWQQWGFLMLGRDHAAKVLKAGRL